MKRAIICTCLAIELVGCVQEPAQPLAVDTICLQRKRTWSVHDSPETIRDADAWNRMLDIRCGSASLAPSKRAQ